ncbi:50S ribosomal protein L5 [Candidatus Wolfebacteria bacterium]|nr:50S ribosomal protein L5 [Candidatus Wolfebacteria bacterium]
MALHRDTIKKVFRDRHELARPYVSKIVVNIGVGRMSQQSHFEEKILPEVIQGISAITGQRPAIVRTRKSIAGFKLRAGQIVGVKATLRHQRMRDFLERLIHVALPRVRDFRGIDPRGADEGGNLSIGMRDISVFPEINAETAKVDFGLEVSIVSTARNRDEAIALYKALGMQFKR